MSHSVRTMIDMSFACLVFVMAATVGLLLFQSGAAALESLRALHREAPRPVVVFAARGAPAQIEAAARIGAQVCEVHTGPYAHAFHGLGRDRESQAVVVELDKVRAGGKMIRDLGMRFNAGHALNYANVQPVAELPGVRELHIGHAIVSRSVFVGLREAVREMKALMREAAGRAA